MSKKEKPELVTAWNVAVIPSSHPYRCCLKIRVGASDVHYAGNLASSALVMGLFADVATEVVIRHDGAEGLLRAYETIEFLAPVHAGDFLEVYGELMTVGHSSRKLKFEAYKIIELIGGESRAVVLAQPLLVAKAVGTVVIKTLGRAG